jgi:hypothetical protein
LDDVAKVLWPLAIIAASIAVTVVVLVVFRKGRRPSIGIKGPGSTALSITYPEASTSPVSLPSKSEQPETSDVSDPISSDASAINSTQVEKSNLDFYFTKDRFELDAAYASFKSSETYATDVEFWETFYLRRRRDLGVGGTPEEFSALAEKNSTWIWPLIELIKYARQHRNLDEGKRYIEQVLARSTHTNRGVALVSVLEFIFEVQGEFDAIKFLRTYAPESTDPDRSALFGSFADLIKVDSRIFGASLFREISLRSNPSNQDREFQTAYAYGNHDELWSQAFSLYNHLYSIDTYNHNTHNNMGVLFSEIENNGLSNRFYERAIKKGSALAACNLAISLANAGFVDRAETVLTSFESYEGVEENRATAERTIHSARRSQDEAFDKLEASARVDRGVYQRFIGEVLRCWLEHDEPTMPLSFVIPDGSFRLVMSEKAAEVEVALDGRTFAGSLVRSGICYEGHIKEKGSTLLGGEFRRVVAARTAPDRVAALIWPHSKIWGEVREVSSKIGEEPTARLPSPEG